MRKLKTKKYLLVGLLVPFTFFVSAACSSEEKENSAVDLKDSSEYQNPFDVLSDIAAGNEVTSDIIGTEEVPTDETPSPTRTEENVDGSSDSQIPESPGRFIEAKLGRPEGYPAELWWKMILDWVNEPGTPVVSEEERQVWLDPANSDLPPEYVAELSALGREVLPQVLLEPNADGTPSQLKGLIVVGATAGMGTIPGSYNNSGNRTEQLYRVAVMWHAEQSKTGRPVANRVTELLFTGGPGAWQFRRCEEFWDPWEPNACVPFLQNVV